MCCVICRGVGPKPRALWHPFHPASVSCRAEEFGDDGSRAKVACGGQRHATARAIASEPEDASAVPAVALGLWLSRRSDEAARPDDPLPCRRGPKTSFVRPAHGVGIPNAGYERRQHNAKSGKKILGVHDGAGPIGHGDRGGVYEHSQEHRSRGRQTASACIPALQQGVPIATPLTHLLDDTAVGAQTSAAGTIVC